MQLSDFHVIEIIDNNYKYRDIIFGNVFTYITDNYNHLNVSFNEISFIDWTLKDCYFIITELIDISYITNDFINQLNTLIKSNYNINLITLFAHNYLKRIFYIYNL